MFEALAKWECAIRLVGSWVVKRLKMSKMAYVNPNPRLGVSSTNCATWNWRVRRILYSLNQWHHPCGTLVAQFKSLLSLFHLVAYTCLSSFVELASWSLKKKKKWSWSKFNKRWKTCVSNQISIIVRNETVLNGQKWSARYLRIGMICAPPS
jgi:hypothetical protein